MASLSRFTIIVPRLRFLILSAVRNLTRAPRRTSISLLAIAFATAALLVFQSFVDGVKTTFRYNVIHSNFGHFQLFKKGYRDGKGQEPYGYPIAEPERIRQAIEKEIGPLVFFSRRQDFFALLSNGDRTIAGKGMGIDAAEERKFLTLHRVDSGQHLADSPGDSIFMGAGLAKQLGLKAGDTITGVVNTVSGSLNATDLTVAGIFKTGITDLDDFRFYVHAETAQKLLRLEGFSQVLIGFADDNDTQLKAPMHAVIEKQFPELEVMHWHELIADYFDNSMGWLQSQFTVFRWIILIIASLSITNVFMMTVLERTGEFGTLRAIGTYRWEIAMQITAESLVQSLLGSFLGILIAIFILKIALAAGVTMPPPPQMTESFHVNFAIPWASIPGHSLLCIFVAGGAGIFPAMKVARLNIVQALGRNI